MGFYRPITAGPPRASLCRACAGTVANEVRSLDILLAPAGFIGLCAINAVVDGDDRRADIDCVALVHQELGDSTGVRTGKLNQRLAGLDLDQNVVDLDFVTDANPPRDDVGFDQTLTRIGQPESLQRHYTPVSRPASDLPCPVPDQDQEGTPPRPGSADMAYRSRQPAAPALPRNRSTVQKSGRRARRPAQD